MDNENFWIPRTLDAPRLFFMWELDSALIFLVISFLGAVMGGPGFMFGVLAAFVVTKGYTRLKEEGGAGLIMKMAYWYTPSGWISRRNPSSIREHVGA